MGFPVKIFPSSNSMKHSIEIGKKIGVEKQEKLDISKNFTLWKMGLHTQKMKNKTKMGIEGPSFVDLAWFNNKNQIFEWLKMI